MVDATDREAAAALTNRVIPISASKENPNHSKITTLAIHDDEGRRSNECRVWGQTMTGAALSAPTWVAVVLIGGLFLRLYLYRTP